MANKLQKVCKMLRDSTRDNSAIKIVGFTDGELKCFFYHPSKSKNIIPLIKNPILTSCNWFAVVDVAVYFREVGFTDANQIELFLIKNGAVIRLKHGLAAAMAIVGYITGGRGKPPAW